MSVPTSKLSVRSTSASFMVCDHRNSLRNHIVNLDEIAATYPDQLAVVVHHQHIHWNYRQYLAQIEALATGLLKLGIKSGDRWAFGHPTILNGV